MMNRMKLANAIEYLYNFTNEPRPEEISHLTFLKYNLLKRKKHPIAKLKSIKNST